MRGVKVSDGASFSRTIAESDIYAFAGLTGDFAPQHTDEVAMRRSRFGRRVAHGAMLVGFMSRASTMATLEATGVVGTAGASAAETLVNLGYDRVRFVAPVFIGDTITVTYRVTEIDEAKRRARAEVTVVNERGETVAVAQNILQWVRNPA